MNKDKRQQVFSKTNGFCYYCGCPIEINNFEVDHIYPKYRGGHHTDINNLAPACRACNRFKNVFTVEEFRGQLAMQVERGLNTSVNMRTAERFGLIEIVKKPVVFYFEENCNG